MLVIDASAAVDMVVTSPRTAVLKRLTEGERLFAPQLIYSEGLSALRRLELGGRLSPGEADAAASWLRHMPVRTVWSQEWIEKAWERRHWLRVSDAIYVAAAQRISAPVLTTDQRLGRALADRSIDVITV